MVSSFFTFHIYFLLQILYHREMPYFNSVVRRRPHYLTFLMETTANKAEIFFELFYYFSICLNNKITLFLFYGKDTMYPTRSKY